LTADGIDIGTIAFEPGAHIRWHSHGNGQILLIDHGLGVIETRSGEVRSLRAADVVYSPPGEEHWHGASPNAYLGQVNISMGPTTWLEEVTPERYRAACDVAGDD
jgi:quercetin dioxygenase-like cupin family protein